jgi:hypothetical protein
VAGRRAAPITAVPLASVLPGVPVYEGLLSGGAVWAPVDELVVGLQASNVELRAVLAKGGDTGDHPVTARTIVVVNERRPDGTVEAATFPIELEWRAYAMVQRLHAIDHARAIRHLRFGPR